jgi:hypothetical protein
VTGPGRPPVGPKIEVRLDPGLADFVDIYADDNNLTRAAAIRELLQRAREMINRLAGVTD